MCQIRERKEGKRGAAGRETWSNQGRGREDRVRGGEGGSGGVEETR